MKTFKALPLIAALLVAPGPGSAMTGLEFLQQADNVNAQAAIMEPIVIRFVSEGYRHVPNWAKLAYFTRDLILEKGYRDKDIVDIAREAAIANGMTK